MEADQGFRAVSGVSSDDATAARWNRIEKGEEPEGVKRGGKIRNQPKSWHKIEKVEKQMGSPSAMILRSAWGDALHLPGCSLPGFLGDCLFYSYCELVTTRLVRATNWCPSILCPL